MEFIQSSSVYTSLHPEISGRIQAGAEIVGDISNDDDARLYVDALNEELLDAKMVGENVQVNSKHMLWSMYNFDGTYEPVTDSRLLAKETVRGVFVGVDFVDLGDKMRTLMYKVRTQVTSNDELVVQEIQAPIERSRLSIEITIPHKVELRGILKRSFDELSDIQDPSFQDDVRSLVVVLRSGEALNERVIRKVGVLITRLMAHEVLMADRRKAAALELMMNELFNNDRYYDIKAFQFFTRNKAGTSGEYVLPLKCTAGINGVVAINDFIIKKGEIVDISEQYAQPAIVLFDEEGEEIYVPLKYVSSMKEIIMNCNASRFRYLDMGAKERKSAKSVSLNKISKRLIAVVDAERISQEEDKMRSAYEAVIVA